MREKDKMEDRIELLKSLSFETLDRELIARGSRESVDEKIHFVKNNGTPESKKLMEFTGQLYRHVFYSSTNDALSDFTTWELAEELVRRIQEAEEEDKALYGIDSRLDYRGIKDKHIKRNADCVAAICMERDLSGVKDNRGLSALRTRHFGKTFNLCKDESFYEQPVASGRLCTGFLVEEDVIATAAHCVQGYPLSGFRFVFGFYCTGSHSPASQVPNDRIYQATGIIRSVYDPMGTGADWALVKLDRKVEGQAIAKLAKENISLDQQVYTLGHPCGLPLKFSRGAQVHKMNRAYFSANLSVYSGNSGSPVFNSDTHEVVGIVVRGDSQDFRWTGKGWRSIVFPNRRFHSNEPECTKVSEFIDYVQ